MIVLDGKQVSFERRKMIAAKVKDYTLNNGRAPELTVVLVGEDPASQVYVRNKQRACESVGIKSSLRTCPANLSEGELQKILLQLNQDPRIDGVLVQLPLPRGLSEELVNRGLSAEKDADGLTYESMGYFFSGKAKVFPCTPMGIMNILAHYKIGVSGMNAVVVGRSQIVGKPMAQMLTAADATVTLCHSKTRDLRAWTRSADLVVVAAGRPEFLGREDFKKDAVVIDVGIHGSGSGAGLVGDVRYGELEGWVRAATPVPGGVGPMTITSLLENTLILAQNRNAPR